MSERRLRILFLAPQPFFEVRGTPLAVLHLTRALAELGPPGRPADVPAGRGGAERRRAAPPQPVAAGRTREGGPLARQDAARRAVPRRGRAAARVRPLRRGSRRRGVGAPRGSVRAPARRPAGRRRGLVDPGPAPLLRLRDARAARVARGRARAARAAPRDRRRDGLRQPDRRREAARARAARVPGRGSAARRPQRRPPPRKTWPRCGASWGSATASRGSLLGQLRALPGRRAPARRDAAGARRAVPVHGRAGPPEIERLRARARPSSAPARGCSSREHARRPSSPASWRWPTCSPPRA